MIDKSALTKIGQTIKPHGISGEILCDFSLMPDDNFPKYFILEDEEIFVPFFIEEYRLTGAFGAFVKFCGVNDENDVKSLCKKDIFFDKIIENKEDKNNVTMNFFVGFRIIDESYGEVGEIQDIDQSTVNTLFVVDTKLIPMNEDFILKIDKKKKIIFTQLPNGLLEL
ncbi:MAG: ribosome maturation factor RimM [Prevotellaceae bacterium]|jgi:16S rRNA processing protein RimM|nr:ribosome maturation factor RimM [Prevotellaceae bacterium]